ncbi:MAG TPA: carboxypeptidase-like regulatory domain-containing protein [Ktedonobacteraceae bacterium]|nr:carboxypeptidase-like regulatory domain-containing protein [Ktedonobacteraceae bacterium]
MSKRIRIPSTALLASILILFLSIVSSVPAHATGSGHITGQLLDGSNHNAPLASQQITLQMAEGNNTRDLATATTDAQGTFSFDNLSTDKTISYAVYIRYQGAQYVSGLMTLTRNPSPRLNLTVYQATQRTDNIAVVDATVLVHEPNLQKGTITVSEVFEFMNLNNRTYVGSLDASKGRPNALSFSLPSGTRSITLGKGFPGYQVIQVDRGMASDAAILPEQNEFSFSFEIPYNASTLDLNYTTMYPTVSLTFLIPPDIHASSHELSSQGVVPDQDQHLYNRFVANVLPTNKNIQLHLEGLAVAPLNIGVVWLIVAILLMNAVVSVTWFLLRAKHRQSAAQFQKEREQARKKTAKNGTTQTSVDKKGMPSAPADRKQKLLEDLLVLDQAYEAGNLSKAVYQERRSKTKAQLRSLMEV